jgi:AcrR family transcriptional regulator
MKRTRLSPPGRQARKAQRMRLRLIEATLQLIRDHGFAAATSQGIARRAGVTWGAAQHHFGSKASILEAILERAYRRFIATMTAPALRQGSRAVRARQFVQRMWSHYQGDDYRVSLEIQRGTRSTRGRRMRAWEQRQGRAHLEVVRAVFHESHLSDARLREVLTFTHCCLTGLALERVFERRVQHIERHLQRIARSLEVMLTGDAR